MFVRIETAEHGSRCGNRCRRVDGIVSILQIGAEESIRLEMLLEYGDSKRIKQKDHSVLMTLCEIFVGHGERIRSCLHSESLQYGIGQINKTFAVIRSLGFDQFVHTLSYGVAEY